MSPAPGERLQKFAGDRVRFVLRAAQGPSARQGARAMLRTNIGRAAVLRREITGARTHGLPLAGASWRDLPMAESEDGWLLELPLPEPGYFKAKAYLADNQGWQQWPEGPDVGITVHPAVYRTANIIYCAFARLFGETRTAREIREGDLAAALKKLDDQGYAAIPPSGKLRDLTRQLPHIVGALGCRILHLLPVNPSPTVFARFGRFGSPYAALDLTAIDPALVTFDRRTTGIEQFRELTYETHLHGARVFLDIVINHTGWGSVLQEQHPEWFARQPDGTFASPGAWGVTWEDLVELTHLQAGGGNGALWDELAEMFLTWCRRGVDGFRCDAGYKVPPAAWQYIVARVQEEFPQTLFLLEGLGGAWEATEALLTEGGMQWAYSELFQNHSARDIAAYLDHCFRQSRRVGLLVHYSETHDNQRLAAQSRAWALLRNRLCALSSVNGGFGFTCGLEWLATQKIDVHACTGLAWNSADNLVPELGRLNRLLAEHPCFFDGARLTRLSPPDSPVYALCRESEEGKDVVLVLVNTDAAASQSFTLPEADLLAHGWPRAKTSGSETKSAENGVDLLGPPEEKGQSKLGKPPVPQSSDGKLQFKLEPGAVLCLAPTPLPLGLAGEAYRRARLQAAWATTALGRVLPAENIGQMDWRALAAEVERSPVEFLAHISQLANEPAQPDLAQALERLKRQPHYAPVVVWRLPDVRRITLVPPGHWLLVHDRAPFRATLDLRDGTNLLHEESIAVRDGHIASFAPSQSVGKALLRLERYDASERRSEATIRFLPVRPRFNPAYPTSHFTQGNASDSALFTNGRGGMARLCVDLGRINSKYDAVLGANLHPELPVDRHVFAKRLRVWVNADGFISPLDLRRLRSFEPGPPGVWNFIAQAGDARTVEIEVRADMLEGRNTTVFHFGRPSAAQAAGKQLPAAADVRLTVRVDLEDRNFHGETKRNGAAEHHFANNTHPLPAAARPAKSPVTAHASDIAPAASQFSGFAFTPAPDRHLRVYAAQGGFHPQPEWCQDIPHPVEQSRGQVGGGDAFSPGWFELPLPKGAQVSLVLTADKDDPNADQLESSKHRVRTPRAKAAFPENDSFGQQLLRAAQAFVVRRGAGKTVIAGYPWFLDWGRDTFISARGLLAAGLEEDVRQLLVTFARFEKNGTLPNTIFGEDASNRDTSDAPLWFAVVCEELAELQAASRTAREVLQPHPVYDLQVDSSGRTLRDVLESIALHYANGTPNGIRMDRSSALIWSPSHFTWMDTNYPASTPREGYPIEIQALWIRLLRQLERIGGRTARAGWDALGAQAMASLEKYFWLEEQGWYADALRAPAGKPAAQAEVEDALRSNTLFPVSLRLVRGERARRCVAAAARYLVVPGALRSLAPLRVALPLPVRGNDGRPLNDPGAPDWGRYEGDEDTRRKPAYHNGTAWTWTFPSFCEALAFAWDFAPEPLAAARAYLGSMAALLAEGCLGQLPELTDGDAPHTQRGCDAQAWSATEALRVWKLLNAVGGQAPSLPQSA
jgi:predicted glycogen debranching enzyme